MSQSFSQQDIELLKRHLQALIEVEFFTIPFYLTATYSFTNAALGYSPDGGKTSPLYDLQQESLSVAVQEMYHLQLASNLANVFDVTPEIPKMTLRAGEEIVIPHLEVNGQPLTAKLGNLPDAIRAMIEIETPDPNPDFPPPNEQVVYASISDLYHAALTLLARYLDASNLLAMSADPNFNPGNKQVAYGTFEQTYNYNAITTRPLVAKVANAITDQGEGNLVAPDLAKSNAVAAILPRFFQFGQDGSVRKEFQPKEGTRFAAYGAVTHFKRFEDIQARLQSQDWEKVIGGAVFYPDGNPSPDLPGWAAGAEVLGESSNTIWSFMTDALQTGFATGNLSDQGSSASGPGFNDAMLSFKYTLPLIWQWGTAPSFVYRSGVDAQEAQKAMDAVDPLCLFHWDQRTAALRASQGFQMNACQGLNQCKGMGWGGIATEKGNGACATADLHTCGANNDCKFEGGCGFLVSKSGEACGSLLEGAGEGSTSELLPPSEQWIPGYNNCGKLGGCETPISTGQVFNRNAGASIQSQQGPEWTPEAKQQLESLMGTSVWDRARKLFAQNTHIGTLPTPIAETLDGIDYDGTRRRAAVAPTSK